MKKVIFLLFLLVFISGCEKEQEKVSKTFFESGNYGVAEPYKEAVSKYAAFDYFNTFDRKDIELEILELSKNYFKIETSYYQEGQYLSKEEIKELLGEDNLNDFKEIEYDELIIKPKYITGIFESNFLDNKGNLKGISVAVGINKYQAYKNEFEVFKYKEVDDKKVIDEITPKVEELLSTIYTKDKMKNVRVLVALYYTKKPNSNKNGEIKYYSVTTDSNIKFNEYMKNDYDIEDEYVINNDEETYTAFKNIKKELMAEFDSLYLSGETIYEKESIKEIVINVTRFNFSQSELIYIANKLSKHVSANFNISANVRVNIKEKDEIVCLIRKKSGNIETNIDVIRR